MARFEFGPASRAKIVDVAWEEWQLTKAPVVKEALRAEAPVDLGEMRDSISYRTQSSAPGNHVVRFRVASDHAAVNNDGHGVILPRTKQALAFFWKLRGVDVVTPSVGPVEGTHFIQRAINSLGLRFTERTGRG